MKADNPSTKRTRKKKKKASCYDMKANLMFLTLMSVVVLLMFWVFYILVTYYTDGGAFIGKGATRLQISAADPVYLIAAIIITPFAFLSLFNLLNFIKEMIWPK